MRLPQAGEEASSRQEANTSTGGSAGVLPDQKQRQEPSTPSLSRTAAARVNVRNSRKYHTITTAMGFNHHWQARIHYYWFKKQKAACGAANGEEACDIGGFTRLLHSGHADDLMDEIPTVVVDMLPVGSKSSSYPPHNRPYAFRSASPSATS